MAKKEITIPEAPTQESLESEAFSIESQSIQKEAEAHFDREQLNAIKKISYYLSKVGLTLEESCLLANVNFEKFTLLLENDELASKIIRVKELEYKKELMYILSSRARAGDDKLADSLLRYRFPNEFAGGKRPGDLGTEDMMAMAVKFIQSSGDRDPLVKETSGQAVIVRKRSVIERISDVLK